MNDSSETSLHFLDYWRVIKMRWPIILIAFLLLTTAAGITCYYLPRQYSSRVVMEVKPDDAGLKIFGSEFQGGSINWRPPTQLQILQSKSVLYPVIERLDLIERWSARNGRQMSMEETYYDLLKMLSSSSDIRGTDMIQIITYSINAQEAADIANTVAESYKERRETEQEEMIKRNLKDLEEEVTKTRAKVEHALKEVHRIRAEQGIIDFNPETIELAATQEQANLAREETQVNELKQRIVELRSQLEQIESLKPEELINALPTLGLSDPLISRIQPVYQEIVVEETRLANAGLGENHPRIKSLHAQREVYGEQLQHQIAALRASLNTRLKVAEVTLSALTEKLDATRNSFEASRVQNVEYLNAKSDYIRLKRAAEVAESKLEAQRIQLGMSVYPVKIWERAEASAMIARPNIASYMAIAIGLGMIVGIALAFFMEYLDTSVKTLEEAEKALDAPVLAVVPKGIQYLVNSTGDIPDAEVYRVLQTNLEFIRKDTGVKTVTIVSGGLGEGKSTTLSNLATTYARGGYKVLIVDADLRRPFQHTILGLRNDVGFIEVLKGERQLEEAIQQSKQENLSLLPAGKLYEDSMGILNSPQMADFIGRIKESYDIVFFDSPPILGLSDASILARDVDATLMVIQYRRFPRSMLLRVKQAILQVGGKLAGVVLNNVDTKRDSNYQYYGQYYSYYNQTGIKKKKVQAPAQAETASAGSERRRGGSSEEY